MDNIIEFIRKECKKNKIKFLKKNSKHILADGVRCSGYFDSDNRVLAVALKHPDYETTLIHEYCHMQQWLEQCEVWTEYCRLMDDASEFEGWLNGEIEIGPELLSLKFRTMANLELDCERRAIEFMKKHNTNIDIDLYIKKSNAYVLSYQVVMELRKWNKPQKAPYMIKEILDIMPNYLLDIDYKLTEEQKKLFFKYY